MPDETNTPKFDYDVFISYSSKDKAWVRGELLQRIEAAGLKAFIDFRDFTRGAPSIKECERGVEKSRKTLLVLTPNYVDDSESGEMENIMAQTLSPANHDLRMIPLLKADCKKPLRIGALTHIDFSDGADLDLAWRQLLTALGKPPEPEPPKEPTPKGWFLAHPYPMPPNFTGRVAERAMLTGWLDADAGHPLLVLRALGGFGKSALVWHWLMHDVKPTAWPSVVWWSFYEGDSSFDHFLAETLEYLSGGKIRPERISRNELNTLLKSLQEPGMMLVLDGFERALRAFSGLDAAYQGDEMAVSADAGLESRQGSNAQVQGTSQSPSPSWKGSTPVRAARSGAFVKVEGQPNGFPFPEREGRSEGERGFRTPNVPAFAGSGSDRDCVSPLAEAFLRSLAVLPGVRSKVLLTTRLCPHVLEAKGGGFLQGCREEELRQMQPADAVEFFRAQGIRGTHTEIIAACEPYGYHPLSLRLLAGLIVEDFQQPGDIATAKRLDVSGDLVQRQNHVLKVAYDSLTPRRQALLGRIACFRSPVKYEALQALADAGERRLQPVSTPPDKRPEGRVPQLDTDLHDLVARGLLHHDRKENRFDLHPIVRRYAYDRLAAPDRAAAHNRLRDYFAAVTVPDKVTRLDNLAPVIELYHHTVRAGQHDDAWKIMRDRLSPELHHRLGMLSDQIRLLVGLFAESSTGKSLLSDVEDQADSMRELAVAYSLTGSPLKAVPMFEAAVMIYRKRGGNTERLGITLFYLAASAYLPTGDLRKAEAALARQADLFRKMGNKLWEAVACQQRGRALAYRGDWEGSRRQLAKGIAIFQKLENQSHQCVIWVYRALRDLLRARSDPCSRSTAHTALTSARRALKLAIGSDLERVPIARDHVRAHWMFGAASRATGNWYNAENHLNNSLELARRTRMVDHEADILIDLARLHAATGAPVEAQRLAEEALLITERCGYVLKGADAHLELAKLAIPRGDKATARSHAQEARRLATCDGPPDYTYKVAYDEAGALLVELGHPT